MNDCENLAPPSAMADILHDTKAAGFFRVSDLLVGSLLRTLAGSKPGGRLLEIGTGTGLGTAWILAGMDAAARLITVEITASLSAIAQRHLGHDPRVEFVVGDGNQFLASLGDQRFDLIFADGGPGKTENLDRALDALAPGASTSSTTCSRTHCSWSACRGIRRWSTRSANEPTCISRSCPGRPAW
jgi:predicted O-methyltransferase YrrM